MLVNPLNFELKSGTSNYFNTDVKHKEHLIMGVGAIIDGHIKEALGINGDMSEVRTKICRDCPLYKKTPVGPVCNSKLWVNKETGEVSNYKRDKFTNGCGCRIQAKTRLSYSHCPLDKW